MDFRILGSLQVWSGDARLAPNRPREQRVLAVLLLEADRSVPMSRIVEAVWDDAPPPTAVKQIRNSVSRLRASLGVGSEVLVTDGAGYRLDLARHRLDARAFESEVARAERSAAAGDLTRAAELLAEALDLWRGPALAGLGGSTIEAAAAVWNERRLAATETFFEHELALGRHRRAVAGLAALVAEYPLRERPVGQLALALYRSGRRAEALAVFAAFRARLDDELGVAPGAELRRLQQRILTDDPTVAVPPPVVRRALPHVPRQLPVTVRHFTGRETELSALNRMVDEAGTGGTVVISAIDGTAGIGKTALAVHWAHRVADRFPDGQLYVNLRGFDPSGAPMAPVEAVRGFLHALEVEPGRIPAGLDAQTALFRSLVAGRRMLVVLDNARNSGQVRPLLPGAATCVTVVTSRDRLAGLVAAEGASSLALDLLTEAEARELLVRRLGAERVTGEPGAVTELIDLCARLPLALNIATARARVPIERIVGQLRDTRGRLDVLDTGDAATDVRAVFSWSYQYLAPAVARMFRLLALGSALDISTPAAASLAGVPIGEAGRALAELTQVGLLVEHAPGRFGFHDLLRAYATELGLRSDGETERREAVHRLLDHYLHTAHAADRALAPARDPITPSRPSPGVVPEAPRDADAALAWFEAELPALLGAIRVADESGSTTHGWQLPWAINTFVRRRGRWADCAAAQLVAVRAAERGGDADAQALAERGLGRAYAKLGDFGAAADRLGRALELSRRIGDRVGEARTQIELAWMYELQERYVDALAAAERGLALFEASGHETGTAETLNTVGWYHAMVGDYPRALFHCRRALDLLRRHDHRYGLAGVWDSLGYVHDRLGDHREALTCYQNAIELFEQLGDRVYEAGTVVRLGDTHEAAGDVEAARDAWRRALAILDELQDPDAQRVRAKLRASTATRTTGEAGG
jgi:DNA-binding SARP family transcriptional activator